MCTIVVGAVTVQETTYTEVGRRFSRDTFSDLVVAIMFNATVTTKRW